MEVGWRYETSTDGDGLLGGRSTGVPETGKSLWGSEGERKEPMGED